MVRLNNDLHRPVKKWDANASASSQVSKPWTGADAVERLQWWWINPTG